MQEYILFSQIPAARHDQVLKILAGVTACQPAPTLEQVMIYQETRQPQVASKKLPNVRPAVNSAPQKLIVKLTRDIFNGNDKTPYTYRSEDVPAPGVPNMISRRVSEQVLNAGELDRFRQGANKPIIYVNQYLCHPAHRFVHGNIIIKISHILSVPEGTGALEPLDAPLPTLEDCKPVDPSGTYVFEACVRIEDPKDSKLAEQATNDLMAFKKQVEGAVDLKVPERLSLDTRVK